MKKNEQRQGSETAMPKMSLYTPKGERKYLNADERVRFFQAAVKIKDLQRTFCLVLIYTGCRISEALALSAANIQVQAGIITFRSLKKRNQGVFREIPVPQPFMRELEVALDITSRQRDVTTATDRLWPWGRTWAWFIVKRVMADAGIIGPQASPKGLRHAFGTHAVQSGVPLNLVQSWLGHAEISTTAIYTNAVGPEEIAIAQRMW